MNRLSYLATPIRQLFWLHIDEEIGQPRLWSCPMHRDWTVNPAEEDQPEVFSGHHRNYIARIGALLAERSGHPNVAGQYLALAAACTESTDGTDIEVEPRRIIPVDVTPTDLRIELSSDGGVQMALPMS